jgi:phosphate transport system substrate-binding protein
VSSPPSGPKRSFIGVALLAVFIASCDAPDPYTDDVPTKGHILLLADEDLRSLVEAEEYVFESIYAKAELDIRYLPEAELLKAVMNDSVRCWIASVQPGSEQEAYYAKRTVRAHVVPICTDGIAVVVNKNCTLTQKSLWEIKTALAAEHDKSGWWMSCFSADEHGYLPTPLFAGKGSGVARTLVDTLFAGDASNFLAQALPDIDSVVARVVSDPRYVGFLPFSAISDLDNPRMKALRGQVKLLAVSDSDTSAPVLPSQSTLADGSYPLRRPVYMILCEGKSGLGTGFVSFVANHKGQRIILKQGLAPAKVPARDVEIVTH